MKTLLITGANNGIGFYLLECWLKEGNSAIAIDISNTNLESIKEKYSNSLHIVRCDIREFDRLKDQVETIVQKIEKIDIAIHNACKCIFDSIEGHSIKSFKEVLDVNLIGAVNLTKVLLPYMREQGHGKIFYTSSGVGVTGFSNISAYSSSKGAIEAFAKCMRIEYAQSGISFHLIHPPLTDTKSSSPLPIPREMKADPKKVGYKLAKRLNTNKFVLTPTVLDYLSIKVSYLFPLSMGKLLNKMTQRACQEGVGHEKKN